MSDGAVCEVANMSSACSSGRKGCEKGMPSLVWLVGVKGSAGSLAVPVLSSSSSIGLYCSTMRESRWCKRSERVGSWKLIARCGAFDAVSGMATVNYMHQQEFECDSG
jgi:hypothetical protein